MLLMCLLHLSRVFLIYHKYIMQLNQQFRSMVKETFSQEKRHGFQLQKKMLILGHLFGKRLMVGSQKGLMLRLKSTKTVGQQTLLYCVCPSMTKVFTMLPSFNTAKNTENKYPAMILNCI